MTARLSLQRQARLIREHFPNAKIEFEKVRSWRVLNAVFAVQPTPTNRWYRVRIRYVHGVRPLVYVEVPGVVRQAHGRDTPHLNKDGTLCLYDHAGSEWSEDHSLVHTIVQWTKRWLFFYEYWLAFGDWLGDLDETPTAAKLDEPIALSEVLE